MEILLWLVPAALVTVLASWGAALAARRDERQRVAREQTSAPTARPDVVDEGVSEARPSRRPEPDVEVAPSGPDGTGERRGTGDEPGEHGHVRRSA